ncbi:MAG: SIS domain-containing protein [Desulfobacteraceae bacterium]|nr:SIS domain-containing protein [Desulfobacteraceae bacterium]MBC2718839.1 SIS domain-containing protein [Desulfobacteraceae bacterium]
MIYLKQIISIVKGIIGFILPYLLSDVYFGRNTAGLPDNSIVFFPCSENILCCGIAGIISFKGKGKKTKHIDLTSLNEMALKIDEKGCMNCAQNNKFLIIDYLGDQELIDSFLYSVQSLKGDDYFAECFAGKDIQSELLKLSDRLNAIINRESKFLSDNMGRLDADMVDTMSRRIESLKDISWCIISELLDNIVKVGELLNQNFQPFTSSTLKIAKNINAVLNGIDRLEVRGRDSAGLSLMFTLEKAEFERFKEKLGKSDNIDLLDQFRLRLNHDVLVNMSIDVHKTKDESGEECVCIAITYKIAAEIGSLGDNISFLRNQIKNDPIFQILISCPHKYHTVGAHTRWASVGAITEPNCHPVDNKGSIEISNKSGIIHACFNGDIDNYIKLKEKYKIKGEHIHKDITTDTKIIPLQIEKYILQGNDMEEAFRLAVNDFEGSHAIFMHSDLAPGKLFLAQKGSGQAIFIGLSENHYMPTSEVYGFVEQTPFYLKMDGEKGVEGKHGKTQGQIFVLNQESGGALQDIKAMFYDGTRLEIGEKDIKHTQITSRDIDRQKFPHYFLKEIFEAPVSVEKTLQNCWKIKEDGKQRYVLTLDKKVFPISIQQAFTNNKIKRIYFVGQGTAGIAAQVCADILNYYIDEPSFTVCSLKASELSGFKLNEDDDQNSMADTLVIAISQSGTTTDTNRAVDMVKERGAHSIAIVNRRDSDITFKVDGVMYTSSGRDIEMSVASTKAFYSQIIAGTVLSLKIASLKGLRNDEFITEEIRQMQEIPSHMRKILSMSKEIEQSAQKLAATKNYWAAVGSGPNKASADEIRIKLSELCYKTISSDYIEDKKHIDLSSEPLIIVCAAGTKRNVINDIIKDTAIFQAHKATTVVIADEEENGFDAYAEDVFHIPVVSQHFAPILNTLVGHIWGYYAALAINEGSKFLYAFREELQDTIDNYADKGLDVYEIVLEKTFREKIASFYKKFRAKRVEKKFPTAIAMASDLTLLLKYLAGRLPVSDFEIDFEKKGTALNMLNTLFEYIGESINYMSRPVDAIKHQAKTVTVGTSRISEKLEGLLFDELAQRNFSVSQLINRNIIVLKKLQGVISHIKGLTLYRIGKLNLLGEPTDESTIEVLEKKGSLKSILSRVEKDTKLKGTKKIIVRQGNVYIGKGRKDGRSILVIPIISNSPEMPNMIEYLLLLNIAFKEEVLLAAKIKALGGKYEHIKNIVQENSIAWDDNYLESVEIEELFGRSAEKIGEFIVSIQG